MPTTHPGLEAKQMETEEFFDQITYDLAKSYEMETRPKDLEDQPKEE
jgi:hypothetical protein